MGIVSNTQVYGLENSFRVSKFPMATDVNACTTEYTKRIKSLASAPKGSGHDNFLKGIIVQFDLSFTIKAWTEGERYHWFDIVSSQSTMHCILKFDLDKSYIKYVDPRIVDIMKEKVDSYNHLITDFPDYMEEMKKQKYLEILYSNPTGFILTAGMTTNYLELKNMYSQRKNHRLPEWKEFCAWIETLPMFKELCLDGDNNGK